MKNLIIYYSKTGKNKKLARELKNKLKADIEEIIDLKNRKGVWGFISGGFAGAMGLTTKIKATNKNPKQYDLLVLLSPIWAGKIAPALRTYINRYKNSIKKYAFLSVSSSWDKNAAVLADLIKKISKKPVASLLLSEKQYQDQNYAQKFRDFTSKLA